MTKRILALFLATSTICASLCIAAFGAVPVVPGKAKVMQTYESTDVEFLTSSTGGLSVQKITQDGNTFVEVGSTTDRSLYRYNLSEPVEDEFVVTADLCKMAEPSQGWQFQVYAKDGKQFTWGIPAPDLEVGVWYSFLFVREGGILKAYKKVKDSDGEYEPFATGPSSSISSGTNAFCVTYWREQSADPGAVFTNTKYYADNIMFYNGTFPLANTQKIEITDAEGGKKLTASVDIQTDVAVGEEQTIAPIIVLFDKKGKFVEWIPSTVNVGPGRVTVECEINLTDADYQALKGGTAELYLWNSETSFKPMMDTYTVTID